jgi:hypothetical protein
MDAIKIGKITSSNVWKLFATPAKVKTYLEELGYERRIKRRLTNETSSRPTSWGHLCEHLVFTKKGFLGSSYRYYSDKTISHPSIEGWCGTPDGETSDSVVDVKCPFTMKSFVELSDICTSLDPELFKKERPEYYWQLVSNSILTGKPFAELIVFCPKYETLPTIINLAQNMDEDQNKYFWLQFAQYDELPYLPEGIENFTEITKFRFEVSDADKQNLTEKIKEALEKIC